MAQVGAETANANVLLTLLHNVYCCHRNTLSWFSLSKAKNFHLIGLILLVQTELDQ